MFHINHVIVLRDAFAGDWHRTTLNMRQQNDACTIISHSHASLLQDGQQICMTATRHREMSDSNGRAAICVSNCRAIFSDSCKKFTGFFSAAALQYSKANGICKVDTSQIRECELLRQSYEHLACLAETLYALQLSCILQKSQRK